MGLNAKKCKEIIFNFLQYQPAPATPSCLSGRVIEMDCHDKLLRVFISSGLSWNKHCECVVAIANKRLYALGVLRKCGMTWQDLLEVYCNLVRSVIKYAAPVWADLPAYLSKTIESIQKRAFSIILPGLPYDVTALSRSRLLRLKSCQKLVENFRDKGFLSNIIPIPSKSFHRNYLCFGLVVNSGVKLVAWTEQMNNFCTYKYQ